MAECVEGLDIAAGGLAADVLSDGLVESHEETGAGGIAHRFDDGSGFARAGDRLDEDVVGLLNRVEDGLLKGRPLSEWFRRGRLGERRVEEGAHGYISLRNRSTKSLAVIIGFLCLA